MAIALLMSAVTGVGRDQALALPPGCVKPAGGFLIVASNLGWNDSETHGAPKVPWPVVTVQQGETVAITLCSISDYPHSFEITPHYITDPIEYTLSDGQVLQLSVSADQAGTFMIQCGLPCPIHTFMQDGEFIVKP